MSDLTVEEHMNYGAQRAREKEAELFRFKENQPYFPMGFAITNRNPGHWDVFADECRGRATAFMDANPQGFTSARDGQRERAFRIRGEPGNVIVMDERWDPTRPHPRESLTFRSVMAAMVYICEELMQEPKRDGNT